MNNFEIVNDLPVFENLLDELYSLGLELRDDQICLTSIPGKEFNPYFGNGSLYYNWSTKRVEKDEFGNEKIVIDPYENPMKDSDFTELCYPFYDTNFEIIYNAVKEKYNNIGRIRLIRSKSKSTMSWHIDDTIRLHYPIKTQKGCFMIIDEEAKFLTPNTWWLTNTKKYHTAVNASKEDRIHLVVNLL